MATTNKHLGKAKEQKKDEFFTQIGDIERELRHYKEHFKDKVVFCNCDDPEYSNFWRYFQLNFFSLGLKKLISTHYETDKPSYKMEIIAADLPKSGQMAFPDYVQTPLKQNGDFRSPECIEILKEADIVVTNPPFSLFREYVSQLIEYDKKFIIIGNQNSLHYKEIFPLIQENKAWLGYGFPNSVGFFISRGYEDYAVSSQHKEGMIRVNGVIWLTNLDIDKRHEGMILYKSYNEIEYPKYVNYDAIEVGKVAEIPCDYDGLMGVPDSFLQHYNPEQFEIVGYGRGDFIPEIGCVPTDFLATYREQGGRGHITSGMKSLCYYDNDGKAKFPYSRIIVRRKQQ